MNMHAFGLAMVALVWGALATGHYLRCDCANSRRGRAARTVQRPSVEEVQHHE